MQVYFLLIYLLWLALFVMHRIIFTAINAGSIGKANFTFNNLIGTFSNGFALDGATAAYGTLVAWLAYVGGLLIAKRFATRIASISTGILMLVTTFLAVGDAFLYGEWHIKITSLALSSLQRPTEVWKVSTGHQLFAGTLLALLVSGLFGIQIMRIARFAALWPTIWHWRSRIIFALWPLVLAVTARGGIKAIPINVSRAYFSTEPILNDAATNTTWFFLLDLGHNSEFLSGKNPFQSMGQAEAETILSELRGKQGHSAPTPILTQKNPNLVFIVLESWSADLVEELGGDGGITPQFSALSREGLLFTNFYANGNRSQQGIAAIFSGFPALPVVTITENPGKSQALPRFAATFANFGYQTDFFYGGQLEYGNIKAFLIHNGFQTITEDDQLVGLPQTSMGVPDGLAAAKYAEHLSTLKPPFMSAFFTLSSHAPYDYPGHETCTRKGREAPYVCSAQYADEALGQFFKTVRSQPWYEHTLFVLVADHSHQSQHQRENWHPAYRRIPFLLLGGALRPEFRGQRSERISSQVDITTTLLHQWRWESLDYRWGNDLFDKKAAAFAYYEIGDGAGWVAPEGEMVYDLKWEHLLLNTFPKEKFVVAKGRALAYLQEVVDFYIEAKPKTFP